MVDVEPVCAGCYGPMQRVTIRHANRRAVTHKICLTCLTGRSIDDVELREHARPRPRLTVVR